MEKGRAGDAEAQKEDDRKFQEFLDSAKPRTEPETYVRGERLAALIAAIAHARRELFILNLPNEGVVSNLPGAALLEVEAVSDSRGARGVHVGECPVVLKGILEKRIAWQEIVAAAAVKGDRALVAQALILDEMAVLPDQAEPMLDELLEASKDLLPQFFKAK